MSVTVKSLILGLFNRTVESSIELIQQLRFMSLTPDSKCAEDDEDQQRFQSHVERYLKGSGHPQHASLEGFLGENTASDLAYAHINPKALRGYLLLRAASGSELMPPGRAWNIKVWIITLVQSINI